MGDFESDSSQSPKDQHLTYAAVVNQNLGTEEDGQSAAQPQPDDLFSEEIDDRRLIAFDIEAPESGNTLQSGDRADWRSSRFFGVYYSTFLVSFVQNFKEKECHMSCQVGIFMSTSSTPLLYAVFSNLIGMPSYRVNGANQVMNIWSSL